MPNPFDPAAIRALADILVDTGLTEIEVANGESRVRVVRAPAIAAAPPTTVLAPVAAIAEPAPVPVTTDPSAHPGAILSPMVGVVYLAPEPGAAPFVTLGQPVTAGQTVLLIEAMKTFNQIKASRDGIISRILVAAGAPVEYGEPLMVID